MCAEDGSKLERAAEIAGTAEDITEQLIGEHEALYVEKLSF